MATTNKQRLKKLRQQLSTQISQLIKCQKHMEHLGGDAELDDAIDRLSKLSTAIENDCEDSIATAVAHIAGLSSAQVSNYVDRVQFKDMIEYIHGLGNGVNLKEV